MGTRIHSTPQGHFKPTGEGRGRATDSTSEPQSTQDVRDSNHERERGPKQEKPGNASKKTSKNNPKTGIREMKLEEPNEPRTKAQP